jgi:ATP-dependent DNA helicase RecG
MKILKPLSTDQLPTNYRPTTDQVPPKYPSTSIEVQNLLKVLNNEMSRAEVQEILDLKDPKNFRENYLEPALADGVIEMKYPDSPNHPRQKYLVTEKGSEIRNNLDRKQ